METVQDGRALTDASLGAERAGVDATIERSDADRRLLLDDRIERDRAAADERLMKFRESADRVLARARWASPPPDGVVALERLVADENKQAERDITDALLDHERQRVDARADTRRRAEDQDRVSHESHRRDTDERLSDERGDADLTTTALADSRSGEVRRADVLAMVTHDLRNPLCVIVVNAEMLAEQTMEPATREAAEEMTRAAARMERLLTDLLDVARIESGTLRIVKHRYDLGTLLSEVLVSYRPLFEARGVTFTANLPPDGLVASFDHDRIVQVLSNLLGNAMKFTPPGGAVDLRAEGGDDEVALVVQDDGPGIPEEALPHLFERFWQVDTGARRGLGLGLYICQNIAEAHGGHVSVQSRLGAGAAFRVALPVA